MMTATNDLTIDFAALRSAMVASQLRPNAVNDPRLVTAMAEVPREKFLPLAVGGLAYRDTAVPIGGGRLANVPIATGKLLNEAYLRATDKVLLIGAAGGYAAAVLSRLVASVVAVEVDSALAEQARTNLADTSSVTVVEGSLPAGAPDHAPYDVLIVDGAVEKLPGTLIDQLAIGGRVVTGIVDRGVTRLAGGKRTAGGFGLADFADIDCVVLPGFAAPASFSFSR